VGSDKGSLQRARIAAKHAPVAQPGACGLAASVIGALWGWIETAQFCLQTTLLRGKRELI
jgi:hypothetical protein